MNSTVVLLPIFLVNKHLSPPNWENLNFCEIKTSVNSLYQSRPDCFKPYSDLFNFQTLPFGVDDPSGGVHVDLLLQWCVEVS